MSKLKFTENKKIRLGVEVEIQLIDPESFDLKPVGPAVLESLKEVAVGKHIKAEIFQSMLEIDTPICENAHQVGESLRTSLEIARKHALGQQALVMMSGTHPFAHYSDRLLTDSERYMDLVDRNKWIARRLQIFGLHVHLGMRNGEHAIAMNNALCHYLPMILAFSASSPFWNKDDTGLASSRITFFEAIPTGGHPCLFTNWGEFESLLDKLIVSNSIRSVKDLWWDIRPNLDYGTIEVRIADCPPTIKEVEALVSLIHSLALYIDLKLQAGQKLPAPPEWILRENKWRASRHGVQCDLVTNENGKSESFELVWSKLKKDLEVISSQLNYNPFFLFLDEILRNGPSYLRQRKHSAVDLEHVVQHLIRENKNDFPDWNQ